MDETEQQKLNEKLAKWAGLGCLHQWTHIKGKTPLWGMDCLICKQEFRKSQWSDALAPRIGNLRDVPNFTNSLDACRKWLIPKLHTWEIENEPLDKAKAFACVEYNIPNGAEGYSAVAEAPVLALCLAVENLIDKEE